MTHALTERRVVRVGPAPVQLVSVDGGRVIVALASGNAQGGWGTTVTLLDGRSGDVRAVVDVGPSPRNATARGHLVYVATHTTPPAECRDAVQVVDVRHGQLVETIPLRAGSRPMMVTRGAQSERLYSPDWGTGTLSEIDLTTASAVRSVEVGRDPEFGLHWQGHVYVANAASNDVSIVDDVSFAVTQRVRVGAHPIRVVVNQELGDVYIPNLDDASVSILAGDPAAVVTTLAVGQEPFRIAPWDSRGRNEMVVLCRAGRDDPRGLLVFVDGPTRRIVDEVALPGRVANWVWAAGPKREIAYITLADWPRLVYFDAVRAEVAGVLDLSHQPEPSGIGPGLVLSDTGGVFVASRDAQSGEGSVTMLTTGSDSNAPGTRLISVQ